MTRDATTGSPNRALALDQLHRLIESPEAGRRVDRGGAGGH